MTRFLRPLASGTAVVVAEACGTSRERAEWGGDAIVFANTTHDLVASVQMFVKDPVLRAAQAIKARELWLHRTMEDSLRIPLLRLLRGNCPNANWFKGFEKS